MSKILIVGAGLSGMVAGIDLARQGREVLIIEAAPGLGGIKPVHPSSHVTPFDASFVKGYTGLDLAPCFTRIERLHFHVGPTRFDLRPGILYSVERGARSSSIDSHLFRLAREAGVEFQFSSKVRDFRDLPPGSIIATGLYRGVFESLGIPCVPVRSYSARQMVPDDDPQGLGLMWVDRYTDLYAYATFARGLRYVLLFSLRSLRPRDLWLCEEHMLQTEGIAFDSWSYNEGAVPLADFSNLSLAWGDKILAGSISGMMDPFIMFGIHGALLSGKIAAMAVTDREGAVSEFERLNRYFRSTLLFARVIGALPMRLSIFRSIFKYPRLFGFILRIGGRAVPGYEGNWALESVAGGRRA